MSRIACKVGVHHGIKLGRGYSFTGMTNCSPMELDNIQCVSRDGNGCSMPPGKLAANANVFQDTVDQEIQTIKEAFQLLESSEAQRLLVSTYVSLCEKCRKVKDLQYARRVLLYVQGAGLEDWAVISYNLLTMLLECGSLMDAHQLFNRLAHPTEPCWTSLMRGYNACGQPRTALDLFQKLQQEPAHASKHAIIAALRACTILRDLECGRMAHTKVIGEMLEIDQLVSNVLVDMYSKCNSSVDAQVVFGRLPTRDLVSWNALIGGYAEHGPPASLQHCLKQMRLDGASPDNVTYLCILKSCEKDELPESIMEVHAEIVKSGFDGVLNVGNYLVHMYMKLGLFVEARQVLDWQSPPNEIMWTALIGGYVEYGNMEEALRCLDLMERYSVGPSDATFACSLKACSGVEDGISRGRKLHSEVVKRALEMRVSVGNSLVNMYCKCGSLLDAQEVFDKLSTPDVFAWNALLLGYVEHGLSKKLLTQCIHRMQAKGVAANATTYLCGLRACQTVEDLAKGQELHAEVIKEEDEGDLSLGNSLVDLYMKCGLLMEAKEVFDELPIRNVVSWNTLISGFAEQGDAEMTLLCLKEMQLEGIAPTATTFLCSLKSCGNMYTLSLALEIHCWALKQGFECSTPLTNSLVNVYSKCGLLLEAQKLFYGLGKRDIISWNSLMGGYADSGLCSEALECMEGMRKEGAAPTVPSFLAILKSCKCLGFLDRGHEVHAMVMKAGFGKDPFVADALVDIYSMFGKLADAESVFDQQQVRSVVTWTALIVGYIEHGFGEKALEKYAQMQQEGVRPDDSLYVCALKACGSVGAIEKGRELYGEVTKVGILEESMLYGNTISSEATSLKQTMRMSRVDATALNLHNVLIDMFCRCGSSVEAQIIFDRVPTDDNATWNTLIAGLASLGNPESSISLFHKMKSQGVQPDESTYAIVLTACNHVGFIGSGHMYIEEMSKVYGLLPLRQHYNCIVDLLSRAGKLDVALALVEKIPFQPDVATWMAVLGGCRKSGNTEFGRHAFECSVSLSENRPSVYFLLSSIYVNAEMWEVVKVIEVMRAMFSAEAG